ncbi:hypothetical protein O0L34_g13618 [Tuta absoluta]|nr:hypothetical protein O0L34_g13618 [Tuta absoluta]
MDLNLVLGAGMSLTEMMTECQQRAQSNTGFKYLDEFYKHLDLIAHVPVRNIGTIGGNLAMKNAHHEFPSDIFLLLETVQATVCVLSNNLERKDLSMQDFLKEDLRNKLIVDVKLPPLSASHHIRTYKIMPRAQNAHAIVNAGFCFKLDSHNKVESANITFGNISARFIRAYDTESVLKGQDLFADETLQKALTKLKEELVAEALPPEPSPACRHTLALGLFYKAVLSLCPSANPRYASGGTLIERGISHGTQAFDTDKTLWPLNQPVPKLEATIQCSGEARFSCDAVLPARVVHVAFVLSTICTGEVDAFDESEAMVTIQRDWLAGVYTCDAVLARVVHVAFVLSTICTGEVDAFDESEAMVTIQRDWLAGVYTCDAVLARVVHVAFVLSTICTGEVDAFDESEAMVTIQRDWLAGVYTCDAVLARVVHVAFVLSTICTGEVDAFDESEAMVTIQRDWLAGVYTCDAVLARVVHVAFVLSTICTGEVDAFDESEAMVTIQRDWLAGVYTCDAVLARVVHVAFVLSTICTGEVDAFDESEAMVTTQRDWLTGVYTCDVAPARVVHVAFVLSTICTGEVDAFDESEAMVTIQRDWLTGVYTCDVAPARVVHVAFVLSTICTGEVDAFDESEAMVTIQRDWLTGVYTCDVAPARVVHVAFVLSTICTGEVDAFDESEAMVTIQRDWLTGVYTCDVAPARVVHVAFVLSTICTGEVDAFDESEALVTTQRDWLTAVYTCDVAPARVVHVAFVLSTICTGEVDAFDESEALVTTQRDWLTGVYTCDVAPARVVHVAFVLSTICTGEVDAFDESEALVTTQRDWLTGVYTCDVAPARVVHVAFVLSTICTGEVDAFDESEALKLAGVVAFFTAKDIPGKNTFTPTDVPWQGTDEEILASKKISYYGQPVALIAAVTQKLALEAAELVKVTYKKSDAKPVLSIQDALAAPDKDTRIREEVSIKAQNKGSDIQHTIKGNFTMGSQYHYTMETQCAYVTNTEQGLKVRSSTQWLDLVHVAVAQAVGLKENQVEVSVSRVGGAYGGKASRSSLVACACALVAHRLQRAATFTLPLTHNMRAIGKRVACYTEYEAGVNAEGVIQYLDLTFYSDCGWSFNDSSAGGVADTLTSLYQHDRWTITGYSALTDTASHTWCRAPGTTEATAIVEHIMERIAFATKRDPTDVRIANLDPQHSTIKDMITTFKKDCNFDERKTEIAKFNSENAWKKKSLKLSIMSYPIDYSWNFPVTISIYHADATVEISHGGVEMGQGINTKVAQVCAYTFKIPYDKVTVRGSNSFISPNSMASNGSITSECVAFATVKACTELLNRFEDVKKDMNQPTWEEIVKAAYEKGISLQASAMTSPLDELQGYHVYGVCASETQLDALSGQRDVTRVDLLEDTGLSLSPVVDVGQIEGAFVMGLGLWTSEQLQYEPASGRLLTDRTWTYKPCGARDIPQSFRISFRRDSRNPAGVLRSKELGSKRRIFSKTLN